MAEDACQPGPGVRDRRYTRAGCNFDVSFSVTSMSLWVWNHPPGNSRLISPPPVLISSGGECPDVSARRRPMRFPLRSQGSVVALASAAILLVAPFRGHADVFV